MLRNHAMHGNNNSIIILFTKNLKQLFFTLDVIKEDKSFICIHNL